MHYPILEKFHPHLKHCFLELEDRHTSSYKLDVNQLVGAYYLADIAKTHSGLSLDDLTEFFTVNWSFLGHDIAVVTKAIQTIFLYEPTKGMLGNNESMELKEVYSILDHYKFNFCYKSSRVNHLVNEAIQPLIAYPDAWMGDFTKKGKPVEDDIIDIVLLYYSVITT